MSNHVLTLRRALMCIVAYRPHIGLPALAPAYARKYYLFVHGRSFCYLNRAPWAAALLLHGPSPLRGCVHATDVQRLPQTQTPHSRGSLAEGVLLFFSCATASRLERATAKCRQSNRHDIMVVLRTTVIIIPSVATYRSTCRFDWRKADVVRASEEGNA